MTLRATGDLHQFVREKTPLAPALIKEDENVTAGTIAAPWTAQLVQLIRF